MMPAAEENPSFCRVACLPWQVRQDIKPRLRLRQSGVGTRRGGPIDEYPPFCANPYAKTGLRCARSAAEHLGAFVAVYLAVGSPRSQAAGGRSHGAPAAGEAGDGCNPVHLQMG